MAKKQGFQYKSDPFVYQELENGTSMAIGMDQSDDDKLKIVTQLTPGSSPSLGNENIIIDPSANGNIELLPNGTGAIETDSNISFTGGTAGITFDGGTNVLDFYETGSWTPVLSFGGGSTGIEYASQTGKYTRIGNVVVLLMNLALSNKGTSTGNAVISGLPYIPLVNFFTPSNPVNITYTGTFMITGLTSATMLVRSISSGSSYTNLLDTNFADNSSILLSVAYTI